ncbi:MAG: hypothetical protein QXP42_00090 [Candidatus Micrarchaeia archaeon]
MPQTEEIIDIVLRIKNAFKKGKIHKLRKIHNECTKELVLTNNPILLDMALISYALAKLIEKPRYRDIHIKKFAPILEDNLDRVAQALKTNEMNEYNRAIKEITEAATKMESADRRYIRIIFDKARLKLASTIYAQGFSLGYASEISGVSRRDILDYVGKTMIPDRVKTEKTIDERLKNVRELFRKK